MLLFRHAVSHNINISRVVINIYIYNIAKKRDFLQKNEKKNEKKLFYEGKDHDLPQPVCAVGSCVSGTELDEAATFGAGHLID